MSACGWIIIISLVCIVVGVTIAFCESEYAAYEHVVIEFIATILILGGLCCAIGGTIVMLSTTPTQHYRIQYMNPNGEVITIEDATNVTHRNSEIIEYTYDGENYTIKSDFVEIKEKKNK